MEDDRPVAKLSRPRRFPPIPKSHPTRFRLLYMAPISMLEVISGCLKRDLRNNRWDVHTRGAHPEEPHGWVDPFIPLRDGVLRYTGATRPSSTGSGRDRRDLSPPGFAIGV